MKLKQKPSQDQKKDNGIPKFLLKIYEMLEGENHTEFVSWSADGASMVIKKPTEFAETVLPYFFKHSNLASFVRQLNMYNFKKQKNQEHDYVYAHHLFRRGKKSQAKIVRKGAENANTVLTESTTESEPVKIEVQPKKALKREMSSLVSENVSLKKNQGIMSARMKEMEEKIAELTRKNDCLQCQAKQQTATEENLREIINKIISVHGSELVQNAVDIVNKGGLSKAYDTDANLELTGSDLFEKDNYYSKAENCFASEDMYYPKNQLSLKRYDSGPFYFNDANSDFRQSTNEPSQTIAGRYPFDLTDDFCNFGEF
eukprot:CAMPEP_0176420974 /NCGR_PEP_ID=MMETSP0127-20121128/8910_1 /TAXON_ID=938130 /ORGANISM="Platyophrya macrostoma, Strain WH" /LENGTH=314 /DNA_ID=CAMNT_0017801641 /DNA_START=33 /DNA_END=977 /DNA_ORIENTATION=-